VYKRASVYRPFDERSHQRWIAVLAVAVLHAAVIWALITGLAGRVTQQVAQQLNAIEIPLDRPTPTPTPTPPPPKPTTTREAPAKPAAASAPEGRKAPPVIQAPVPAIVILPQVPAAPQVASGSASAGSGTGAGGSGNGSGSGSAGNGSGGGGNGVALRARQIKGSLKRSDYPSELRKAGIGGEVSILVTIGTSGMVDSCAIVRGSGVAQLDEMTCRLVKERYQFKPARNASGQPVQDTIRETHFWWSGRRPPPLPPPPIPDTAP